jgi:hypothetical protein
MVVAAALLFAPATTASAASAPTLRQLPGTASGVGVLASNDAWVVGSRPDPADQDEDIGMALHWDGHRFTEFPTPSFGGLTGGLVDVSLSDPTHGFAVGNKGIKGFRDQQIVVERWDGNAWTLSNAPDRSFNDVLTGVAAVSADDAWAVGAWDPGGTARDRPLVEHWNGSAWSIVSLPDVGFSELDAVDAVSADDVWAVGSSDGGTLTMHWDGSRWTRIPSPNLGQSEQALADVSAVAADDVWAVGTVQSGQPFPGKTLVIHWDGSAWSPVRSPSPTSGDIVTGVVAFGAADSWMVGTYFPNAITNKALTVRFTAAGAQQVTVPGKNSFDDVDGVAPDDVWTVGGGIFHNDGTGWRRVVAP